jgi:hypothetical protein
MRGDCCAVGLGVDEQHVKCLRFVRQLLRSRTGSLGGVDGEVSWPESYSGHDMDDWQSMSFNSDTVILQRNNSPASSISQLEYCSVSFATSAIRAVRTSENCVSTISSKVFRNSAQLGCNGDSASGESVKQLLANSPPPSTAIRTLINQADRLLLPLADCSPRLSVPLITS